MTSLSWFSVTLLATSALVSTIGCKPRAQKNAPAVGVVASAAQTSVHIETGIPQHMPKQLADQLMFRVLVGPQLLIQPGKGLGPIRFGATAETIERLMEAKPTQVVQVNGLPVLRYQSHAVEFTLQAGAVVKMQIHGNEREYEAGKGSGVSNVYGIFNGAFANGGKLGMYAKYAGQGEPKRVETVEPGRFPTVEKHHYEDMVLEFDKLNNGNVVLAGVTLTKPGFGEESGAATTP